MKQVKTLLSVLVIGGMMMTACEKSESPIQGSSIDLKFNTVTTPVSIGGDRKAAMEPKDLAFTSGFITLSEVSYEVESDEESVEVEFEIEMNTKVDFATGETNPDISAAVIPAGTYNEMEVEIELQDEGDAPAMVLHGTYVDIQGVSHDVRFEYNSGETFEVEKEGIITFEEDESVLAQITFDPTVWFAEVSNEQMAEASKNTEGVIVISETQNADIFDTVADGLDLATEIEIEMK